MKSVLMYDVNMQGPMGRWILAVGCIGSVMVER